MAVAAGNSGARAARAATDSRTRHSQGLGQGKAPAAKVPKPTDPNRSHKKAITQVIIYTPDIQVSRWRPDGCCGWEQRRARRPSCNRQQDASQPRAGTGQSPSGQGSQTHRPQPKPQESNTRDHKQNILKRSKFTVVIPNHRPKKVVDKYTPMRGYCTVIRLQV